MGGSESGWGVCRWARVWVGGWVSGGTCTCMCVDERLVCACVLMGMVWVGSEHMGMHGWRKFFNGENFPIYGTSMGTCVCVCGVDECLWEVCVIVCVLPRPQSLTWTWMSLKWVRWTN